MYIYEHNNNNNNNNKKHTCILKHIMTENITDTNILIKAVIVYVGKMICLKACGSNSKKEN